MKAERKLVNVRMSEGLAEDLSKAAEALEISQSQFVRDAVREKIAAIRDAATPEPSVEMALAR